MHREPRRNNRTLPEEYVHEILTKGLYGVLGTLSSDGFPYVTPLSYIYHKEKIYFHSAHEGLKMENIASNQHVSFTVTTDVETLPGQFSTKYQSVVLFGRAYIAKNQEKEEALMEIIRKYAPDFLAEGQVYIEGKKNATTIVGISILHATAKGRLE